MNRDSCGEGGIRTLGTVARTLDWGCPHRQCSPPAAAARFLPHPNSCSRPQRPLREALRHTRRGVEWGRASRKILCVHSSFFLVRGRLRLNRCAGRALQRRKRAQLRERSTQAVDLANGSARPAAGAEPCPREQCKLPMKAVPARRRARSRAYASNAHSARRRKSTTSPIRTPSGAHPFGCHEARRAARSASTDLGEVGGAQRPKAASTDGCPRRSASYYEGAAAEREGFEPSVRLPVHLISSQAPSTTRSPLQVILGAKRAESGSRRGVCQR